MPMAGVARKTSSRKPVSTATDTYAAGVLLYALLTGRAPFEGVNLVETITKIRQEPPVKPSKFQLAIPHPFEMVVMKLLEKRPEDRYATADDLLRDVPGEDETHFNKPTDIAFAPSGDFFISDSGDAGEHAC